MTATTDARTGEPAAQASASSAPALFGRGLLYVVVWSLQLVAGTVISPVLAHVMGPAEFGALASAIALHQVLSVLVLVGLDQTIVLQRSSDADDRASRGLIAVGIALSAVVSTALAATLPLWSSALGFQGHGMLVVLVLLWTAPSAAVQVMLALLLAEDRIRAFSVVSVFAAVGGLVFGLALLFLVHRDATTYAWGGVISQFAALAIGWALTRPRIRGLAEWRVAGRAMRLGFPLALSSLAYFVLSAGDRIVIQRELGTAQVGRYQVAYVVGSVVILLLTFTSSAWTPRFAAMTELGDRIRLATRSRDSLYGLLVPTILGVSLASRAVLQIVAPASFSTESLNVVVFVVALSAFPFAASGATGRVLITLRRGVSLALIAGVAAALNIVLNLLLLPLLGIAGAALATFASYAVLAGLQILALPRGLWSGPSPRVVVESLTAIAVAGALALLPVSGRMAVIEFAVAIACIPWFGLRLLRAQRGDAPGETRAPSAPKPRRVVAVDLADGTPDLPSDSRYETALVIGWHGGTPVGAVDVDLRPAHATVEQQLEPLRELARRAGPDTGGGSRDPGDAAALPAISVVVPTIASRGEDLAQLVATLRQIDYPDAEFILVDNRREPAAGDLESVLAELPNARVVREPRPGISAARNAGVAAARNQIVLFTDDDVRVDRNWLRAVGRRFHAEPELEAVTGLILPAELETPAQIWFERYYGGFGATRTFEPVTLLADPRRTGLLRGSHVLVRDRTGRTVRQFAVYGVGAFGAGANMAFRKRALERIGGFDNALGTGTPARGGEDLAALISLLWTGGAVGFEPGAVVHHRHRRNVDDLLRQLGGYGLGFTAMLAALIVHDRRHLLSLCVQLPHAGAQLTRLSLLRVRRASRAGRTEPGMRDSGYPRALVLREIASYAEGPIAYARSRRAMRLIDRDRAQLRGRAAG